VATPYPANVQSNFPNACETNATVAIRDCMLSNIEAYVQLSTFEVADRGGLGRGHEYPSWLLSTASACAGK
jgi:hypothetical protein